MADENKTNANENPSGAPNDGLAAVLLRIEELDAAQNTESQIMEQYTMRVQELESAQKIHQQRIQELLEQRESLEERLTTALNGLTLKVQGLEQQLDILDAALDGLSERVVKLEHDVPQAAMAAGQGDGVILQRIEKLEASHRA
jgi:chromosome segregation ATPase